MSYRLPMSPNPWVLLVVGAVLGCVGTIGAEFARDSLRQWKVNRAEAKLQSSYRADRAPREAVETARAVRDHSHLINQRFEFSEPIVGRQETVEVIEVGALLGAYVGLIQEDWCKVRGAESGEEWTVKIETVLPEYFASYMAGINAATAPRSMYVPLAPEHETTE